MVKNTPTPSSSSLSLRQSSALAAAHATIAALEAQNAALLRDQEQQEEQQRTSTLPTRPLIDDFLQRTSPTPIADSSAGLQAGSPAVGDDNQAWKPNFAEEALRLWDKSELRMDNELRSSMSMSTSPTPEKEDNDVVPLIMSYRRMNGKRDSRTIPASPGEKTDREKADEVYENARGCGRERNAPLKLEAMSEDEEVRLRARVRTVLDQQSTGMDAGWKDVDGASSVGTAKPASGIVRSSMGDTRSAPAKPAAVAAEWMERYTPPQILKPKVDHAFKSPAAYTQPFCEFLTENPTVFHVVAYFEDKLSEAGFKKLSERKTWNDELATGGKYYVTRNGSSLIAFSIGPKYKAGNGVAMVAGHVDALTAKLKPVSTKKTTAGYVQLGVAPYAGGLNSTWWDRDLGIGGRVLVKDPKTGKINTKLVKLGWPIARIPTLAPHFGIGMLGQENKETQMVPIIGLDNDSSSSTTDEFANLTLGSPSSFAATQPPKLLHTIATALSLSSPSTIINWELELYDTQPAQTGGLDREFIFGGRIDDKVCSWAAIEALLAASSPGATSPDSSIIQLAAVFDDEEIGSLLRQGARSNFLPSTIERVVESFASSSKGEAANLLAQSHASSFLISADVTHAVNPNFLSAYLSSHSPRLNVGLCIACDSNGHMTTDAISTSVLTRIAEKHGDTLQLFQIRNDLRSGGTIGPALSTMMGVRAVDAGVAQLSMHSVRATIGDKDPGLAVGAFEGFFGGFEGVDAEFE